MSLEDFVPQKCNPAALFQSTIPHLLNLDLRNIDRSREG